MNSLIVAFDTVLGVLGTLLFAGGVAVAALAGLSYAVRTRRINPFSGVARLTRGSIDPLLAPIERRVVRAGGRPASAPWWALAAYVVAGIVLLNALRFLEGLIVGATTAAAQGPGGIVRLLVSWTFGLLQIALMVRVLSSWLRGSEHSAWVRWSFPVTEWFMRPLRRVIPPLGMIDVTPIVAYFLLSLLQPLVLSVLPA